MYKICTGYISMGALKIDGGAIVGVYSYFSPKASCWWWTSGCSQCLHLSGSSSFRTSLTRLEPKLHNTLETLLCCLRELVSRDRRHRPLHPQVYMLYL